jgi:PDZ-binding kinase
LFVVKEVSKALHYLHTDRHLLHGDLKAANVLVVGDFDTVKLCDFGVTLPLDKDGKMTTETIQYIGTEPWSAKEVIYEGDITSR